MKTLVTGGCGFIGSHLVASLLKKGDDVVVIDNFATGNPKNLEHLRCDRLRIHQADISSPGPWSELFSGVSNVVHLAALIDIVDSVERPQEYFKTNAEGTFHVLEASRKNSIKRFVYLNSGACYGIADSYPTTENAPLYPQYPYALTKLMGEQLTTQWALVYGLPAISLRIFNLYGPRCGALFGLFLSQRAAGKPLTVSGDGSQTRDFTYISDVVDAIHAAIQSTEKGEIFNIGSGTTVPVLKVAKLLNCAIQYVPRRPGEMNITYGDISKARARLNWEPKVGIEEGVKRVLEATDNEG